MDISIATSRRTWVPLVAVALLAVGGLAIYLLTRAQGPTNHRSGPRSAGAPVILEQAPWRIRTYPTGRTSKLSKSEKARLRKQREPLTGLVKDLHAALFLEPSTRKRVVRRLFAASAAGPFLSARPGLNSEAEAVRTVRRRGRIGIQAHSARRAAGTITIVARVENRGDTGRIGYRSDLFLEKRRGHWRVVAFETDQRRLPEREKKKKQRERNGKEREGGKGGGSK